MIKGSIVNGVAVASEIEKRKKKSPKNYLLIDGPVPAFTVNAGVEDELNIL